MSESKIQMHAVGIVLFFTLITLGCRNEKEVRPALIPMPQNISWSNEKYDLSDSSHSFIQRIVEHLPGVTVNEQEAYALLVTRDSVVLSALTPAGISHGMKTVRQLTRSEKRNRFIEGCNILDWPAFKMRGFMQDVGRNFQSMEMLKEQIDVLAAYKFNVFHFHVTDNPGWRLESKLYPQLNSPESMSRWPGMYYTREDFKELVEYCHERQITLIPEIDLPGHSAAFRKAFGFESMSDPRVQPILIGLIDELAGLAPPEKMPYIHLGTDEVWHSYEEPSPTLLPALLERITQFHNREVIVWRPGYRIEEDSVSITQLWSSNGNPRHGHRYLDSRLNYLNHLDPLAGMPQLFFERINGAAHGDSLRMGGILCCWNDNLVADEYDVIRHNPVYPGIVVYSETSWKGQPEDFGEQYLAKFPPTDDSAFQKYAEFEERMIRHRDRYFENKPFPYVKQTHIRWRVIGPFDHEGDLNRKFAPEDSIIPAYSGDSVTDYWSEPVTGATVHLNHFFGYPSSFPNESGTYYAYTSIWSPESQRVDAWIGFHDWSRSGGRRGGLFPEQGQWHNTNPQVWVNGINILPPQWNNPGLDAATEEVPFSDENYYFREPASIQLEKGWNKVLLKIPVTRNTWKRMFTFVPVQVDGTNVREIEGLKFSADIR